MTTTLAIAEILIGTILIAVAFSVHKYFPITTMTLGIIGAVALLGVGIIAHSAYSIDKSKEKSLEKMQSNIESNEQVQIQPEPELEPKPELKPEQNHLSTEEHSHEE